MTVHTSPSLFGPTQRRLNADLTQVVGALVGIGLGLAVPRVPVGPTVVSSRAVDVLFSVGFGVLGLVSLLFSLLFVVVQWAASSFTPRLRLFRNDPLIWRTFAVALGLFTYSLTAALTISPDEPVSAAVPAVALLALLGALALLRSLQVRAFRSLQLAPTLAAISARGNGVLARAYPAPYGPPATPPAGAEGGRSVRWNGATGVLQRLDLPDLVLAAVRLDARVRFTAAVGDVLWPGTVLAVVHGDALPDSAITDAVELGLERSFDQDPGLAFRLFTDIGLRALSPAVNDPATAVQVLDAVQPLLRDVMTRELGAAQIRDGHGTVRIIVPQPTFLDLLTTVVDDMVAAAAGSPMVLTRLATLLTNLRREAPPPRAGVVQARLEHVQARLALVHPFAGTTDPVHDDDGRTRSR